MLKKNLIKLQKYTKMIITLTKKGNANVSKNIKIYQLYMAG